MFGCVWCVRLFDGLPTSLRVCLLYVCLCAFVCDALGCRFVCLLGCVFCFVVCVLHSCLCLIA